MRPFATLLDSVVKDHLTTMVITGGMILGIAAADIVVLDLSLGILYVLPVILASAVLPRGGILALAAGAALLREALGPLAWSEDAPARTAIGLGVFALAGLFSSELVRNRLMALETVRRIEEQMDLRRQAEQELSHLVESSPGAIVTVGEEGKIQRANQAACQLLGFGNESPVGRPVTEFLPMLEPFVSAHGRASQVRTMVEGGGRRRNGEVFYVQLWVSAYQTPSGPRLAAIFSDATEVLRDREELGLRQLLMSSRIVAAAVAHEVRNLSAAAYTVYRNLGKSPAFAQDEEYRALGELIEGLRKLSAQELGPVVEEIKSGSDVTAVLEELRLILEHLFHDSGTKLEWEVTPNLPRVRADHHGLMQVFLNLAQNSHRAVQDLPDKRVRVVAYRIDQSVVVRLTNSGPPIPDPSRLFQPLQPKATATGLGLFLSRAMMRTYGGDLLYRAGGDGGYFLVELPVAEFVEEALNG